jgi:antitoxin component YwqK of YwqJK toxin-antitoxin module
MDEKFFSMYSPSELYATAGCQAEYISYTDQNMTHLDIPYIFPSECVFKLASFIDMCQRYHADATELMHDHEEIWVGGILKARGSFYAGRPFGRWRFFHENGQCAEVVDLDLDGNIKSEHVLFYQDGKRMFCFAHTGEELTGILEETYLNGQIKSKIRLQHGKREGICRQWHENGYLSFEGSYKEGVPDGKTTLWNETGIMIFERVQVEHTKVFYENEYTDKGQLKGRRHYLADHQLHGEELVYFDDERRMPLETPQVNYYLHNKPVAKVEFFARGGTTSGVSL